MHHPSGLPVELQLDRTLVMGVVNVTPDSFSDGGQFLSPDAAISQGRALALAGADILDIGGESTRPGSERVTLDDAGLDLGEKVCDGVFTGASAAGETDDLGHFEPPSV